MKNATKIFVVGALATSGFLAFACGGGSSEGGGATTPSASAPAASSLAATSEPTTTATSATSTAAATTAAAVPAGPPLTVAAMKLVGPTAKHTLEMKEDGSVLGDGKPVAKFVGATLQDAEGKTMISVAADGTIAMPGQPTSKSAKFNDKDELVISDGAKMIIGDDGVVKLFNPDGKADKDSGKMKLTGFKPTARRAATVFVLTMMMSSPEHSTTTTTSASAAPVLSAKPVSTAKK